MAAINFQVSCLGQIWIVTSDYGFQRIFPTLEAAISASRTMDKEGRLCAALPSRTEADAGRTEDGVRAMTV